MPDVQRDGGVQDELAANEAAGIVARGVVVAGTHMVCGAVAELARVIDAEQAELRPAARIAVADHGHRVAGHHHLVVPGAGRVDIRRVGVDGRHRQQLVAVHIDREQAPPAQDDQVLAMHLDNAALIHAGRLVVGDGLGGAGRGRRRSGRGHGGRGGRVRPGGPGLARVLGLPFFPDFFLAQPAFLFLPAAFFLAALALHHKGLEPGLQGGLVGKGCQVFGRREGLTWRLRLRGKPCTTHRHPREGLQQPGHVFFLERPDYF